MIIDTSIWKVLIVLWLAVCAYWDVRKGEVPNALTLPSLVLGALAAVMAGWAGVTVFGAVLLALWIVYSQGLIGGADVKILGSLAGLWPQALIVATLGMGFWIVGRRLIGRKGRFRAVLPMSLAALGLLLVERILFLS